MDELRRGQVQAIVRMMKRNEAHGETVETRASDFKMLAEQEFGIEIDEETARFEVQKHFRDE